MFAAATVQAIGRCATNITEVTDTCLNGLVLLLSNRDGEGHNMSLYYSFCSFNVFKLHISLHISVLVYIS